MKTPLAGLSPRSWIEHPRLAMANLCRLLGLTSLEEWLVEREAEALARRCGEVEARCYFWGKGLLAAEVDRERERLGVVYPKGAE